MARSKAKKKQEVDDTEYTVEAIKDHERTKGKLRYFVKWKGYDKPSDNTWEPEDEIKSITQVVERYWKSKKPEERLERYKVNSKEYKALQAELLEGEDEEEREEGEEEEEEEEEDKKKKAKKGRGKSSGAGKKRKSSEQANGSSSSKKAKKEKSEEVEETEKEGEVNEVENGNGEEALEAGSEGWDSGTRALIPWKEISESQKVGAWEDLIMKIDTVEKDENSKTEPQGVKMLCIWHKVNHDGDHFESWVPAAISRKTCPQKMLDFFLSNLKFRTTDGLTEEDMAKLAEEEAAEAAGGGEEERQDSPAHGEVEL